MKILTPENYRQGRIAHPESFATVITALKRAVQESDAVHGAVIIGSAGQSNQTRSSDLDIIVGYHGKERPDISYSRVLHALRPVLALARKLYVPVDITVYDLYDINQQNYALDPLFHQVIQYYEKKNGVIKNGIAGLLEPKNMAAGNCSMEYMARKAGKLRQSGLQYDWLDSGQKADTLSDILHAPVNAARYILLATTDNIELSHGCRLSQLHTAYHEISRPAGYLFEVILQIREYNDFLAIEKRDRDAYDKLLLDIWRKLPATISFLSENMKLLGG